jgi:hypothetical protein
MNSLPASPPLRAPAPPPRGLLDSAREKVSLLVEPSFGRQIHVHLEGEGYQNIDELQAARMLGHFTQKMQEQGFPWRLYVPAQKGLLRRGRPLSEMEALARLKRGEPVLFEPRRMLQLDLSPDSIGALATVGSLGGADTSSVGKVAAFSKNSRVAPGSQGIELSYGTPVTVSSFGELKLLHELYNPDARVDESNRVSKAAHQLSYFASRTLGHMNPWRFYKPGEGSRAARMVRAAARQGLAGALVGAGLGLMIGGPLALLARNWDLLKTLVTLGAGVGGAYMAVDAARVAGKGEPINAVETLERLLEGQPTTFQETQLRSVGVPILGKISWFSDYGQGSSLRGPEDLNTFYYMQDQTARLPEPPEPPRPQPPAPPQVIIVVEGDHYQQVNVGQNQGASFSVVPEVRQGTGRTGSPVAPEA